MHTVLFRSLILVLFFLSGCGDNIERATEGPRPQRADRSFTINAAPILRGTVASETVMRGYQPVLVRGYGLVVGLRGTGSRTMNANLRAHMLSEMALRGIGSAQLGFGNLSPEAMLASPDTAVVVVKALVPPGAIEGTQFDVRVAVDSSTDATSLENGRLYTTALRPGPLLTGSRQAATIASASGPIFINPFSEPDSVRRDYIDQRAGRILNGGVVTRNMPLKLRLASPSHRRAEDIQTAINSRFPNERGQREPTARGESDEAIRITVPPSYRNRSDEFVNLLRHMTIRTTGIEQIATNLRRAVVADPSSAEVVAWRWQALGRRVLPIIAELYDHPEEQPRLAALRAGARLDDPLVIPHLIDMTQNGSDQARNLAVELLERLRTNPRVDVALRDLLDDEDVEVRLSAYEALIKRGDPYLKRYAVSGKFLLDVIPSNKPLIYITQIGQPRIAVFGEDLTVKQPSTVFAWSDRFMVKADADQDFIEVFYREPGADRTITALPPDLATLIRFLGHDMSIDDPQRGVGMSYGETVGALHAMWRQDAIDVDFKAQQDRILAQLRELSERQEIIDRPEFDDDPDFDFLDPAMSSDIGFDTGLAPAERPASDLGSLQPALPTDRP